MKSRIIAISLLAVISLMLVACVNVDAKDLPSESSEKIQADTMVYTGRMIVGKSSYLIVDESNSPISMSVDGSADEFFAGYSTGDKIEVLSSPIAESYPGQAFIYKVKLVEKGSINDISSEVITDLKNLGWIN